MALANGSFIYDSLQNCQIINESFHLVSDFKHFFLEYIYSKYCFCIHLFRKIYTLFIIPTAFYGEWSLSIDRSFSSSVK